MKIEHGVKVYSQCTGENNYCVTGISHEKYENLLFKLYEQYDNVKQHADFSINGKMFGYISCY